MAYTYDYRPSWGPIVLGMLVFGGAAGAWGTFAVTNDRGLILNHVIKLSAGQATVFYWVLFALSMGLVAASCMLAVMRLVVHQQVVISKSAITLPRSRWTTATQTIAFADIYTIELAEVAGERLAHLAHRDGIATVTASMLPKNSDFDAIVQTITNRSV